MPPHFEYIILSDDPVLLRLSVATRNWTRTADIKTWIYVNLLSRFCVIENHNNRLARTITVGFEDPSELSIFNLACPHVME